MLNEFFLNNWNQHLLESYCLKKKKNVLIDFTADTSELYVFFGGISKKVHSGKGIPVFEYFNIAKALKCKKIFIRDFTQAWYHRGFDESKINNLVSMSKYLKDLIKSSQAKRIVFVGNSMGGYAALLFGRIIPGATKVIAFNPQTFTGKSNFLEHKELRWQDEVGNIPENTPSHLLDLKHVFLMRIGMEILDSKYTMLQKMRTMLIVLKVPVMSLFINMRLMMGMVMT